MSTLSQRNSLPTTTPPTAAGKIAQGVKAPLKATPAPSQRPAAAKIDDDQEEFDDDDRPFYRRSQFYLFVLAGVLAIVVIALLIAAFSSQKCGHGDAVALVAALDPTTKKSAPFVIIARDGTMMLQNNPSGSLSFVKARSVTAPTAWHQFYINSNNQVISQADGYALTMGAVTAMFAAKQQSTATTPASQIWMLKPIDNASPVAYALYNQSKCVNIGMAAGIRFASDAYGPSPVDIVMLSAYTNYIMSHGGFENTKTATETTTLSPVSIRLQTQMGVIVLTLEAGLVSWQPLASAVDTVTQRFVVNASETTFGTITTIDGAKVLTVSDPLQEGGAIVFAPKPMANPSDLQLWRIVRDDQNQLHMICKAVGSDNATVYMSPMMDSATRIVPAATMNATNSYPVQTV